MRRILLTTTALVALGSVSAVAADVSVSGNMRFRYNTWSDDNAQVDGENNNAMTNIMQLWVRSSATSDNGLSIGTNTRIRRAGNIDRNWIDVDGEFGQLDLGQQWSLSYSQSLHENWMGTVAGGVYMGGSDNGAALAARDSVAVQASRTTAVTSRAAAAATNLAAMNSGGFIGGSTANKINYHLPSIAGLNIAIGYGDAGALSDADETTMSARYAMPFASGNVTLNYASISTDAATPLGVESFGRETGVQYSADFGRVYFINQNVSTEALNGAKANDQEGTTIGGQYNLDSASRMVYYRQKVEQDGTTNNGDEFSSDTVGYRYDMTGGLRIGLLHTNYDFTDSDLQAATNQDDDGSATRLEIRVDF
ncbi:porin [Alphaproteobacteria bacterium]|nr:porin [Alphaproteobacteria bacterium]